jgi:hypothetical protein
MVDGRLRCPCCAETGKFVPLSEGHVLRTSVTQMSCVTTREEKAQYSKRILSPGRKRKIDHIKLNLNSANEGKILARGKALYCLQIDLQWA